MKKKRIQMEESDTESDENSDQEVCVTIIFYFTRYHYFYLLVTRGVCERGIETWSKCHSPKGRKETRKQSSKYAQAKIG